MPLRLWHEGPLRRTAPDPHGASAPAGEPRGGRRGAVHRRPVDHGEAVKVVYDPRPENPAPGVCSAGHTAKRRVSPEGTPPAFAQYRQVPMPFVPFFRGESDGAPV